jgi:phage/plasmid-associated DNA primase
MERGLNEDKFELPNLLGKKLIIINDMEIYKGEVPILKQIIGGDSLHGRIKYQQGSQEIHARANVVMVANQPLSIHDPSKAVIRRVRAIKADTYPKTSKTLFTNVGHNQWSGLLVKELPGILNWVLKGDPELTRGYICETHHTVPSLYQTMLETQYNLNPLTEWVDEYILKGEGSFLGLSSKEETRDEIEYRRRGTLYPVYKMPQTK